MGAEILTNSETGITERPPGLLRERRVLCTEASRLLRERRILSAQRPPGLLREERSTLCTEASRAPKGREVYL